MFAKFLQKLYKTLKLVKNITFVSCNTHIFFILLLNGLIVKTNKLEVDII